MPSFLQVVADLYIVITILFNFFLCHVLSYHATKCTLYNLLHSGKLLSCSHPFLMFWRLTKSFITGKRHGPLISSYFLSVASYLSWSEKYKRKKTYIESTASEATFLNIFHSVFTLLKEKSHDYQYSHFCYSYQKFFQSIKISASHNLRLMPPV